MSCVKKSAGSMRTDGPLSISTSSRIIFLFITILSLGVQTGFCSSDSQSSSISSSESQAAAALALLAQWAKATSDIDTKQSSSISSTLANVGRQDVDPHVKSTDLERWGHDHVIADEAHDHGWYPHSPISHDSYHHHHDIHVPVDKPFSIWEWIHTDGWATAVPLILFGVIPILLGIIPIIVILANFWIIFNKIYGLHALFLGLLGSSSLDDSYGSYGSSYGWSR